MKLFRDFLKDRCGATAVTFGLMLVPILGVTGLAVDYSVATNERAVLQDAADTAALAGASVFTGANAQEAENLARTYLKANLGERASTVTVDFKAVNQKVSVTLGGQINTTFMRVLNQDNADIAVNATALAPLKPSSATIKVDNVYGHWFKRVTVVAVKNGVGTPVGTVVYQPTDHSFENGRGTGTTVPTKDQMTTITLSNYDSVYLKMEVKEDGCDIGYRNPDTSKTIVKCVVDAKKKTYNRTLTTDNVDTVHYLYVDGKQLPPKSKPPLTDIFKCDGGTHKHAWEDGGGWAKQDFFYTVTSECKSVDGDLVRLTH